MNEAAKKFLERVQEKKRQRKIGQGYLNLPQGLDVYEPKEGVDKFDIVPFVLKNDVRGLKAGEKWFELTYYVHYGIGVDGF